MIERIHFRGCISSDCDDDEIMDALEADRLNVQNAIKKGQILTTALYRHKNMVFLYLERLDESVEPDELFEELSMCLELWPGREGMTPWARMAHIYYHDIPKNKDYWARKGKKKRRGRIAYLVSDEKLFSYTYWHKAIVDEGLLEGDRYQSIALHENILFSYFEEPKIFTHIKKDIKEESKVIEGWLAQDPESHFDHQLSGKENFLLLPELFSMGVEDL